MMSKVPSGPDSLLSHRENQIWPNALGGKSMYSTVVFPLLLSYLFAGQFWGLGTMSSILLIFQVRKHSPETYSHTSSPKVPGQKGEDMIPVDVTLPVPILLWLSLGDTWRHPHPPQTRGCSQGRPLPQDSIEPKGWFSQSDYTHSSLTNLPV